MSPAALRQRLAELDVRLAVRGDQLLCDAPLGVLTHELRAQIASQRDTLMDGLRSTVDWDEAAIQEAIRASLQKVDVASHPGALMGVDEGLAAFMEEVNVAYQRQDFESTLRAIQAFEAYALEQYASTRIPRRPTAAG